MTTNKLILKIKDTFSDAKLRIKIATQGIPFSFICLWLFIGLPLLCLYKLLGLFVELQNIVANKYNKIDDLIIENRKVE